MSEDEIKVIVLDSVWENEKRVEDIVWNPVLFRVSRDIWNSVNGSVWRPVFDAIQKRNIENLIFKTKIK